MLCSSCLLGSVPEVGEENFWRPEEIEKGKSLQVLGFKRPTPCVGRSWDAVWERFAVSVRVPSQVFMQTKSPKSQALSQI